MAAVKEVVITISRDGESVIEANNFMGVGCKAATKELEMVLAGADPDNKSDKKKPEFAMNPGSNRITN